MILSDRDLRKRITTLEQVGLKPEFLEEVAQGKIPRKLDLVLKKGKIIIDPPPPADAFDADTIDLRFGTEIEIADTILEVVKINERRVIRRLTRDYRNGNINLLERTRKVSIEDEHRIKFTIDQDETVELQPGMLALAHTLEIICVPYDIQMELNGKSRLARDGMTSHVSSPIFHAGWVGHAVLEVINISQKNFNVYPGMSFASASFRQLSSPAQVPYIKKKGARYSGQR